MLIYLNIWGDIIIELLLISISLAADAFAVSILKGVEIKKIKLKHCLIIGMYFGLFQAIMPLLGYFVGHTFEHLVVSIDHYIVFILLSIIGINMILDTFSKKEVEINSSLKLKEMSILAFATSVDAFAVGITFSFLKTNIFLSVSLIGIITFIISSIGTIIGASVGKIFEKKAQLIGGIILILIGAKILFEHLNIY